MSVSRKTCTCPECYNKTLILVNESDGLYICDECTAEFIGTEQYDGSMHFKPVTEDLDESTNNIFEELDVNSIKVGDLVDFGPQYDILYVTQIIDDNYFWVSRDYNEINKSHPIGFCIPKSEAKGIIAKDERIKINESLETFTSNPIDKIVLGKFRICLEKQIIDSEQKFAIVGYNANIAICKLTFSSFESAKNKLDEIKNKLIKFKSRLDSNNTEFKDITADDLKILNYIENIVK